MPFDPRIVRPDDFPEPELEVSADPLLEALGEQLRDDAQMLANRFPARWPVVDRDAAATETVASQASGLAGRWRIGSAAAIVLALLAGTAYFGRTPLDRDRAAQGTSQSLGILADAATNVEVPVPTVYVTRYELPVETPSFSGPEWEGVLDLLEQQPDAGTSLSL